MTGLLILVAVIAGICDWHFRRVPNWLVAAGALLGLAVQIASGGWGGLGSAAAGLAAALVVYLPLYFVRAVGAGDVKLMAALGIIGGYAMWIGIFLATAICGGVIAVAVMLAKGRVGQTVGNLRRIALLALKGRAPWAGNPELDVRRGKGLRLPHGVSVAVGTVIFVLFRGLLPA